MLYYNFNPYTVPTTQPAGLVPSIPNSTYTVMFPINDLSQSQSFTFVPIDDNIPNEPNEIVSLVFDFISDGRVAEGDSAVIVIIDDDASKFVLCSAHF